MSLLSYTALANQSQRFAPPCLCSSGGASHQRQRFTDGLHFAAEEVTQAGALDRTSPTSFRSPVPGKKKSPNLWKLTVRTLQWHVRVCGCYCSAACDGGDMAVTW